MISIVIFKNSSLSKTLQIHREASILTGELKTTSEWTLWKTRDKEWSPVLEQTDFHQFLNIHKDNQVDYLGFKIKGWCRKGDIRTTNPRKSFECWVKTSSDVPTGAQKSLTAPQYNVGKDEYTVDLEINEKLYWLVTESSTFTGDWILTEGENRDKLGE